MMCVGLMVMWCYTAQQVDSFCQVYQPVVQAKGDGSIAATPAAKKRILANELIFRKLCPR
jgi:hypothetical protein